MLLGSLESIGFPSGIHEAAMVARAARWRTIVSSPALRYAWDLFDREKAAETACLGALCASAPMFAHGTPRIVALQPFVRSARNASGIALR